MAIPIGDTHLPEVMQAARFKISVDWPYLSSALWAVVPAYKPDLPAITAVDKYWRLYWRDDIATLPVDEVIGLWCHEVLGHLLGEDAARGEALGEHVVAVDHSGRTLSVWNVACDLAINDHLREQGVKLPMGAVYPEQFGFPPKRMKEDYYERLRQQIPTVEIVAGGCGSGRCGTGATGGQEEGEAPPPKRGGISGRSPVNDVPGVTPGQAEAIRRAVAEAVSGLAPGTAPGWMERWADRLLHPVVPWERVLPALIRGTLASARSGYAVRTYRRPPRRNPVPQVVLPSWYRLLPNLVIQADTSGSMGTEQLARVLAETNGICRAAGASVTFMSVDAAVGLVQKVTSARDVKLVGGGGTDMGVGLAAATAMRPRPDLVIVITDGYTPWPCKAPSMPVIIANVTVPRPKGMPAWAKVVDCVPRQ